jgi:hypothetical protein
MNHSKIEIPALGVALLASHEITLNLNNPYDGEVIPLCISSEEHPPLGPFAPNITEDQLQALWLITECSVTPEKTVAQIGSWPKNSTKN